MLKTEIKEGLFKDILRPIYAEAEPLVTEEQIKERIEVFSMALSLGIKDEDDNITPQLNPNLETDISNLLEAIIASKIEEVPFEKTVLLEEYLKQLYYFINRSLYYQDSAYKKELMYFYNKFNIARIYEPEDKNKKGEKKEIILYGDVRHPENRLKDNKKILPFVKAYCFRNAIIHKQIASINQTLSIMEKWEHFFCAFYTMVEVAYKNEKIIINKYAYKGLKIKQYITQIINKYEEKQKNGFTYIALDLNVGANEFSKELSQKYFNKKIKFDEINEELNAQRVLETNNFIYNRVKLVGYAGVGKTTILENTMYKEALSFRQNGYEGKIPVLIEMIKVSKIEDDLKSLIAEKLKTNNVKLVSELIKRNKLQLYIDGINEIRISDLEEKRKYLKNLEEFISKMNRGVKIVITDRDSNEFSILNEYPTFIISGINKNNVTEFIHGNSNKPEVVNKIISEKLENKPEFINMIKNPFMLKNLIAIIECNKEIPESEEEIAEEFLKAIVERERVLKRDYRAKHIIRLLIYVVKRYSEENEVDDNMVISSYKLLDLFNEYCDKYNSNDRFDNGEMLDLLVKMGILKEASMEEYTFVDYRFFSFFMFQALSLF